MASLTAEGFAGVSATDVATFVLEAPMRGTKRTAHRQALRQVMAGDVPEAFKKNWNKDGDSDSDSKSDDDSGSDTKGDTTGNGKPDWLEDKIDKDKKESSRKVAFSAAEMDQAYQTALGAIKTSRSVVKPEFQTGMAIVQDPGGYLAVYTDNAWERPAESGMLPWHAPVGQVVGHVSLDGNLTTNAPVTASRRTAVNVGDTVKTTMGSGAVKSVMDNGDISVGFATGPNVTMTKSDGTNNWVPRDGNHAPKSSSRRTAADSPEFLKSYEKAFDDYDEQDGDKPSTDGMTGDAKAGYEAGWTDASSHEQKSSSRQQPQPRIAAFARSLQAGLRATALGADDEGEFMKGYNHANNPTSDGADPKSQSEAWQKGFKAGMEDKGMDH
jgi:hypothetical protein